MMQQMLNKYRRLAEDARMYNDDAARARARAFDEAADMLADAAEQQRDELMALVKEARKIIRASSSRSLAKDWDQRATAAYSKHRGQQ